MSAEGHFQALTRYVRDLLECGAVALLPGCPDQELRHPLCDPLSSAFWTSATACGELDLLTLLEMESVRALCDLALQSGRPQCSRCLSINLTGSAYWSVAAAPLERPAGVLGLLLLADTHHDAFCSGERALLEFTLVQQARELEREVRTQASLEQRTWRFEQEAPHQRQVDLLSGKFISIVSHELRTPLTAIKGYAGLLQAYGALPVTTLPEQPLSGSEPALAPSTNGAMSPRLQQQYLDIIMEQANHLEILAGDLLDISRIETDHLAVRCSRQDIAVLCQQVVSLIQDRVDQEQSGKYYIRCLLDPELPPIWADAARVQQIFSNLLENAVKYSPAGGLIEVQARMGSRKAAKEGEASVTGERLMMQVIVSDQGIGISAEQQERLFTPFTRLEHPATSHVSGVGLGLYITRILVEAMGGEIALHSREGEGTRVTFTLPLEDQQSPCEI